MNNDSSPVADKTKKLCPHCQKEVAKGATKCPFCQSDLRNFLNRHPILSVIGVFIVIGIIMSALDGGHGDTSTTAAATPATPASNEARTLGQEAFLRLPGNPDEKQVICLAPTKEVYDAYFKALSAQDYQGILDLSNQGLFCVHNGSEVKVIDTSFTLTKVRVVKGADKIDADKVGEAGWSASEWVVTQ